MRRRLFTILSALSLALCLTLTAVWVIAAVRSKGGTLIPTMGDRARWSGVAYVSRGDLTLSITIPASHPISPPLAIGTINEFKQWLETNLRPHEYGRFGFTYYAGPTGSSTSAVLVPDYGPIPAHQADVTTVRSHLHAVTLPMWFMLLLTAALPVRWAVLARRRSSTQWRLAHGLCASCGYDLRASTERCPECGTPIPAQTASSSGRT